MASVVRNLSRSRDFEPQAEVIDATVQVLIQNADVDFNPCVATLEKLLNNVLLNPNIDSKFRKVPLSSQAFRNKVINVNGAVDFLQSLGWRTEGSNFVFPPEGNLQLLSIGHQLLNTASSRHHELQQQIRSERLQKAREIEESKKAAILEKAAAARKENAEKESYGSHSQLRNNGPNVSNFKTCGVDLNKGGG